MTFVITLTEAFQLLCLALIALIAMGYLLRHALKPWRCKHPTYYETRACQAACPDCGKELGFVGALRKDKTRKEV